MFGFDLNDLSQSLRSSILKQAGLPEPPAAMRPIDDWLAVSQELNSPLRNGDVMPMFGSTDYTRLIGPSSRGGARLEAFSSGVQSPRLFGPLSRLGAARDTATRAAQQGTAGVQKVQPFQQVSTPANISSPVDGDLNQALALAVEMFGPGADRVLNTTISAEGGWNAGIGDTHLNPAGSHGPLQFYGGGGQLNNFAAQHGMSVEAAGAYVRSHPLEAVKWALNNYYGNALRAGMDLGLRGADLAEYVQMNGQRSDPNITAGKAKRIYQSMYGE
jgi:hypothetical protein